MSSHLIQTTINATPTTLYTSTVATVSNISSSFANNSELAINIAFGVFASTAALITILMTWRQIRVVKSNTAPTQSVQMTAQNHSNCDGITLRSIEEGSAGIVIASNPTPQSGESDVLEHHPHEMSGAWYLHHKEDGWLIKLTASSDPLIR